MNKNNLAAIYAHRGYHDKPRIPENSMAAFRRAVDHGLASELDVHLLADGSLAVFHDEELERQTGVRGTIEDYDRSNLSRLRLEGTDERIPMFDEVLELYEDTGLPLLIELKVNRGNYKALAAKVCERLDSYKGPFALQSFDPRAMMEIRKLRPQHKRGQLSKDFFKEREGLPFYQVVMLTNMALNRLVRPDFLNYKFSDRDRRAVRRGVERKGLDELTWTIRSAGELRKALEAGCIPIFENITPEELEPIIRDFHR